MHYYKVHIVLKLTLLILMTNVNNNTEIENVILKYELRNECLTAVCIKLFGKACLSSPVLSVLRSQLCQIVEAESEANVISVVSALKSCTQ